MKASRRTFLQTLSVAAAGAACRVHPFGVSTQAAVGIAAAEYNVDLADTIGRLLRELRVDVRGRRVLLKPNLVEYEEGTAINTHPAVVVGAAVAMRRAGATSVVVAEGPGHRRDTEYLLDVTGLADYLREDRLTFIDLNHDDVRWVPLRGNLTRLDHIALPVTLLDSDFVVSLPKLKTHHWAVMTASMKNFFGVVPGAVYGWPKNILHIRGLHAAILDLYATIRPHLAIVDAIVGMEGDGPIMGSPRHLGCLVAGTDLPAVDATCARLVGIEPTAIPYLRYASGRLGTVEERSIAHVGERPETFATEFALLRQFASARLVRG